MQPQHRPFQGSLNPLRCVIDLCPDGDWVVIITPLSNWNRWPGITRTLGSRVTQIDLTDDELCNPQTMVSDGRSDELSIPETMLYELNIRETMPADDELSILETMVADGIAPEPEAMLLASLDFERPLPECTVSDDNAYMAMPAYEIAEEDTADSTLHCMFDLGRQP